MRLKEEKKEYVDIVRTLAEEKQNVNALTKAAEYGRSSKPEILRVMNQKPLVQLCSEVDHQFDAKLAKEISQLISDPFSKANFLERNGLLSDAVETFLSKHYLNEAFAVFAVRGRFEAGVTIASKYNHSSWRYRLILMIVRSHFLYRDYRYPVSDIQFLLEHVNGCDNDKFRTHAVLLDGRLRRNADSCLKAARLFRSLEMDSGALESINFFLRYSTPCSHLDLALTLLEVCNSPLLTCEKLGGLFRYVRNEGAIEFYQIQKKDGHWWFPPYQNFFFTMSSDISRNEDHSFKLEGKDLDTILENRSSYIFQKCVKIITVELLQLIESNDCLYDQIENNRRKCLPPTIADETNSHLSFLNTVTASLGKHSHIWSSLVDSENLIINHIVSICRCLLETYWLPQLMRKNSYVISAVYDRILAVQMPYSLNILFVSWQIHALHQKMERFYHYLLELINDMRNRSFYVQRSSSSSTEDQHIFLFWVYSNDLLLRKQEVIPAARFLVNNFFKQLHLRKQAFLTLSPGNVINMITVFLPPLLATCSLATGESFYIPSLCMNTFRGFVQLRLDSEGNYDFNKLMSKELTRCSRRELLLSQAVTVMSDFLQTLLLMIPETSPHFLVNKIYYENGTVYQYLVVVLILLAHQLLQSKNLTEQADLQWSFNEIDSLLSEMVASERVRCLMEGEVLQALVTVVKYPSIQNMLRAVHCMSRFQSKDSTIKVFHVSRKPPVLRQVNNFTDSDTVDFGFPECFVSSKNGPKRPSSAQMWLEMDEKYNQRFTKWLTTNRDTDTCRSQPSTSASKQDQSSELKSTLHIITNKGEKADSEVHSGDHSNFQCFSGTRRPMCSHTEVVPQRSEEFMPLCSTSKPAMVVPLNSSSFRTEGKLVQPTLVGEATGKKSPESGQMKCGLSAVIEEGLEEKKRCKWQPRIPTAQSSCSVPGEARTGYVHNSKQEMTAVEFCNEYKPLRKELLKRIGKVRRAQPGRHAYYRREFEKIDHRLRRIDHTKEGSDQSAAEKGLQEMKQLLDEANAEID